MLTLRRIGLLLLVLSISYGIGNGAKLPKYPPFGINGLVMLDSSTSTESTSAAPTLSSLSTISTRPTTIEPSAPSTTVAPSSAPTETTPHPTSTVQTTVTTKAPTTTETTPNPTSTVQTTVTTKAPTTTETTPNPTSTVQTTVTTKAPTTTETTPNPTSTVQTTVTTKAPTTTETTANPTPTVQTTVTTKPPTTTETTPNPTSTVQTTVTTKAPTTTETTPNPTSTVQTTVTTKPPTTTETTANPTSTVQTTVTTKAPTTTETTANPTSTVQTTVTTKPPTTTETTANPTSTVQTTVTTKAPTTTETTPNPTSTVQTTVTTKAPTTTETTPNPTSTVQTTVTTKAPTTTETTPNPTSTVQTTVTTKPPTTTETTANPTSTVQTTVTTKAPTTTETTPNPTTTAAPSPTTTETTQKPTPTPTLPPTTTEEPIGKEQKPCILRDYGYNSYVCVCNATYCDTIPPIEPLPEGEVEIYSSNRVGRRFFKEHGHFRPSFNQEEPVPALIYINPQVKYQTINGFGSALTDAAGININSLNSGARRNLLRSYFSQAGIEYSLVQVPLGSTDFSTHPYTYNDGKDDPLLKNFKLAPEDYNVKIPLIKEAQALQNNLTLLAAPWAAPAWMKSNGQIGGPGILKSPMYQPWANYLVKFLEAYEEENLEFWGITTGNRPNHGRESTPVPSLGWLASQQGVWVAKNLGPTLQNSPFKDVNILAVDDQRNQFPTYADLMFLANEAAKKVVDGFGTQWQDNEIVPSSVLSETHKKYGKIILTTSARAEPKAPVSKDVQLGVWDHAEKYIHNIIEDINNWSTGWVDSNLALDLKGGPSFIPTHNVEAPVIVNATAEEFYKQPIFYAQGHVSKFVPIGSERIGVTKLFTDIDVSGFRRPDGGIVVVIFNKAIIEQPIQINDIRRGQLHFNAAPRSISTVVYW